MQIKPLEGDSLLGFTQDFNTHRSEISEKREKTSRLSRDILSTKDTGCFGKIKLGQSVKELSRATQQFSADIQQIKTMKKTQGAMQAVWKQWIEKTAMSEKKDSDIFMDDLSASLQQAKTIMADAESLYRANFSDDSFLDEAVERLEAAQEFLSHKLNEQQMPSSEDIAYMRTIGKDYPELLFEKDQNNVSTFTKLLQGSSANIWFDLLIPLLDNEKSWINAAWKSDIIDFGLSKARYEAVFTQDRDVSPELARKLDEAFTACSRPELGEHLNKLRRQKGPTYQSWIEARMGSSDSLTGNYNTRQKSRECWLEAEAYIIVLASQHANKEISSDSQSIHFSELEEMHAKMSRAELDVPNPGVTRDVLNKNVRAGGAPGFSSLMCPSTHLKEHLNEFENWLNGELLKCDRKEKNPLLLGAQAYERFVTLHPFENANGRAARMLMDYILERYHIPPIILGNDILDIAFPLMPTERRDKEKFLEKIIEKIHVSAKFVMN